MMYIYFERFFTKYIFILFYYLKIFIYDYLITYINRKRRQNKMMNGYLKRFSFWNNIFILRSLCFQ